MPSTFLLIHPPLMIQPLLSCPFLRLLIQRSTHIALIGLTGLCTLGIAQARGTPTEQVFDRWTLFRLPGQTDWTAEGYSNHNTDAMLSITFSKQNGCDQPTLRFSTPAANVPIRYANGPYPGTLQLDINHKPLWQTQQASLETIPSLNGKHLRYSLHTRFPASLIGEFTTAHTLRIRIPDSGIHDDIDLTGAAQAIAMSRQYCERSSDQ